MAKVRKAGADVVDRELRASVSQRRESRQQRVVVVDLRVLGDLDHEPIGDVEEQLGEAWIERGRRRDVDRKRDVGRKLGQTLQCRPDRRKLELGPEADLGGLRKPDRRRANWLHPEASEGFKRHDAAVGKIEHRLELDVELVAIEHRTNAGPLQPPLLAFELLAVELVGDDLGEDAHEADVPLVQRRLRRAAETAERAVEAPVPKPNGDSEVGADAGFTRQG